MLPQARLEQLTIRELPQETLVYDNQRHKAHCLNRTAALVWKHCDGETSIAELAQLLQGELAISGGESLVRLALEQLSRRHLLEAPLPSLEESTRIGRRDALKKLGLALAALPLVMTITSPAASAHASQCRKNPDCFAALGVDEGCAIVLCVRGICQNGPLPAGANCVKNGVAGQCDATGHCLSVPV